MRVSVESSRAFWAAEPTAAGGPGGRARRGAAAAASQALPAPWCKGVCANCAADGIEFHAYVNRHPAGTPLLCKRCGQRF